MSKAIKKYLFIMMSMAAAAVLTVNCTQSNAGDKEIFMSSEDVVSIERGRHLVIAGACHDCHSPKIMTASGPRVDSSRILSGHPSDGPVPPIDPAALKPGRWIQFSPDLTAFVGPWGMSYSANITSDSATGIGLWDESNFVKAIRTGRHMGFEHGRPIQPPMPWDNYNNLSDNDLKSIFAYLKSTKPISNRVRGPFTPDEVRQMIK